MNTNANESERVRVVRYEKYCKDTEAYKTTALSVAQKIAHQRDAAERELKNVKLGYIALAKKHKETLEELEREREAMMRADDNGITGGADIDDFMKKVMVYTVRNHEHELTAEQKREFEEAFNGKLFDS